LQAAIGALTADALGLGAVLGGLADMPAPTDPFSKNFPFFRIRSE
jgi:hypothetical protein